MTPGARLSAAIDVLGDIEARRRPAADALKDWGLAHRFAGSGDRAAIGGLVFDALRRRQSAAWLMEEATPRAILFGALKLERGMGPDAIRRLADGGRFAPAPPTAAEAQRARVVAARGRPRPCARRLSGMARRQARRGVRRGSRRRGRGARPPRAGRPARQHAAGRPRTRRPSRSRISVPSRPRGRRSACASRSRPRRRARRSRPSPPSSAASSRSRTKAPSSPRCSRRRRPGETIVDLCAGGGGKTLALAALIGNRGRIIATDADIRRLAPIHARLARAGATNVEVRTPRGAAPLLDDIKGTADLVVIDAPCTGIGAWRRNPDAKWRVRPGSLEQRIRDQDEVLARAAPLVREGGRIAYITCSLIDDENGARVRAFLAAHPEFAVVSIEQMVRALPARADEFQSAVLATPEGLLMTPRRTATDGFFVAIMARR